MRKLVGLVVAAVLAGACTMGEIFADYGESVDMSEADLVGTWQSGDQRSITFAEDGGFVAANLPFALFDGWRDPNKPIRIDAEGTWTLEPARPETPSPHSTVALDFTLIAGEATRSDGPDLSALRQDDGRVLLFFFYVDQGNSWTAFEKCAAGSTKPICATPRPTPTKTK